MGRVISILVSMFVFAFVSNVQAEQSWGPENCPTVTTPGAINWNAAEHQLFTAGLTGCFENIVGDCDPDGNALRLRNIGTATLWVRFTATGDVWRIMAGDTVRLHLDNNGGGSVFVETRACSLSRRSWTYERQLTIGSPRYGTLSYGGDTHYSLTVTSNQYVRITLVSDSFDAYLRLYHNGELIAFDDDHDGTLNSEIFQFLPVGVYSVEVSSYENLGGGGYVLQAR